MYVWSHEEALPTICKSVSPLKAQAMLPLPSREEDGEQKSSRPAWAVTSVVGIALSCVVSVTIPFFDIVAAIGALGDLAAAYALPALFVLASTSCAMAASCWIHTAEKDVCSALHHSMPT